MIISQKQRKENICSRNIFREENVAGPSGTLIPPPAEVGVSASRYADEEREAKWRLSYEYARRLVEDGGVSTKLFVDSLGEEKTKEFFYSIFFAPYRYGKAE